MLDEQLSYWMQHLAAAPALLALPTDKPRPAIQAYHGAQISVLLPATLRDELKTLSQREGATLFMTLLAAFQVLLLRYSGQEQIVTGTPIAGRTRLETENLIGFFVNTLALRGDLSGNPTFQELLQRTREAALGAYSHQELPFEKLVEKLQPERSLSYAPIFQVMFAMQNIPSAEMQWGSLRLTPIKLASTTAKFDLSLDVYEKEDGLEVWLEYDTALFEAATAERMLAHLQTLLAGISANPLTQIQALPLLTAQEEQQMLLDWNQSTIDVPALFVHQLFAQQAEQNPMAIAVTYEDQRITYRALNARANQVAHYLQKIGVGPEVIVGLYVERSIEMVIGLLGILQAGGAYLPLDPNYPRERLTHMLNDAGVKVLLTQQRLANALPPHDAQMIYLDADWQNIAQESEAAPVTKVTSENLAYVIYTSGSTGKPKGVMVTHGNMVNAAAAWEAAYHTSTLHSHLQMASFSFDVFTGDLVRALCSGAKLVLCPTEYLLEPERLYGLLRTEAVDAAEFVPAVIRPLIQYLQSTNQRLDFMRLLVVGSDTWQREEYRQLRKLCGKETRVINSYGVTEATIDSTFFAATALPGEGMIPIGRPFPNTQLYILDQHKNPVPIGVSGELYIGGRGITRGYLNRPELTEEKFIVSSFRFRVSRPGANHNELQPETQNSKPETRLYRTGDLARSLPDGTIELLGRVDTQVKLRGYRIELGEIEALIRRYPAMKDCAVIVREDEPDNQRLVAYLVTKEPIVNRELQTYLKSKLPEYMVPATFVLLDQLPLTPNGKVDRKKLPLPDEARLQLSDSFVAPRTATEKSVANIWAGLLRLEQIGSNDNFFDLGGHSLLAIRVNARLQDTFGIRLSLRSIFECPTVATLAATIDEALTPDVTDEDLAALLKEIEGMSDDEAQHLLADVVC